MKVYDSLPKGDPMPWPYDSKQPATLESLQKSVDKILALMAPIPPASPNEGVVNFVPNTNCTTSWEALDNAVHGYDPRGNAVRALTSSYKIDEVGAGALRTIVESPSGNKVVVVVGSFDDAAHELDSSRCLPLNKLDFTTTDDGTRPVATGKRWSGAKDPYAAVFMMQNAIIKTQFTLDAEKGQFPGAGFGDSYAYDGSANGTQKAKTMTLDESFAAYLDYKAKTVAGGGPSGGPA